MKLEEKNMMSPAQRWFKTVLFYLAVIALGGLFLGSSLQAAEKKTEAKADAKKETKKEEKKSDDKKDDDGYGEDAKGKDGKKKKEETFMGMKKLQSYVPKSMQKKLKVSLNMRYRFEYQENKNFNDGTLDKDGFSLLRTRLNLDFKPMKMFRAFVQLQDSRIWGEDRNVIGVNALNAFEDSLDIRQGFFDIILSLGKDSSLTFRLGREELSYGSQRLIGGFNWSNVAQSFDVAKVIFKKGAIQADLFTSRKVLIDRNEWNNHDHHDTFSGLYVQYKGIKNQQIHFYYLFRDTDRNNVGTQPRNSELDESTIGIRAQGKKIGGLDYVFELAYQFGKGGRDAGTNNRMDISSMALILGAGYTLPVSGSPRFGFEVNYASGDERTTRGTIHTFDNLFPTNHGFYGILDRQSLRNVTDYVLHFSARPTKNLWVKVDMHFFFLNTSRDNLYHAGRGVLRAGTTTPTSDFVGSELDVQFKYKFNSFVTGMFGVAHYWTGSFLRNTGADDHGEFAYFMVVLKF